MSNLLASRITQRRATKHYGGKDLLSFTNIFSHTSQSKTIYSKSVHELPVLHTRQVISFSPG